MTPPEPSEASIDRRILIRVTAVSACFLAAFAAVNALTLITDARRVGVALDPIEPFLLEYTSIVTIVALVPLIALLERRFPIEPEGWPRAIGVHLLGAIACCALHIAGMVALRKMLFGLLIGQDYTFFDDPLTDVLYEFRKDALTYALVLIIVTILRAYEEQRRGALTAGMEARATGRLTLKSGGRTIMVDAAGVEWARAAANYVEVRAGGRTHLARTTLAALETQLAAAGAPMVRIHRSYLVNRTNVVEIRPTGDGDYRVTMRDGAEFPGSRRTRAVLEQ